MSRLTTIGLYIQSFFYLAAGINHLWHSQTYLPVLPDHYVHRTFWVAFTGIAEIAGAIGLVLPSTRRAAAIGIIALLLGYFEVHIFMLGHAYRFPNIPQWALVARLLLQFVLIAWAAVYVRRGA